MNKYHSLLVLILLLLPMSTTVSSDQTPEPLTILYQFDTPTITQLEIDGTLYDEITLADLSTMAEPGLPSLPIEGCYLLLPYHTSIETITATPSNMISLGKEYLIKPGSYPVPLSQKEQVPPLVINPQIYSIETQYPGKLYTEIGTYICKGYPILVLQLHPIQYIPNTGELLYTPTIEITLTLSEDKANSFSPRGLTRDINTVKKKIDNPYTLTTYPQQQTLYSDPYDYLIITTNELQQGFAPLKTFHDQRGIKTTIKTLHDIGLTPNKITPEDIRTYITKEYKNHGIEYVLIGGDADIVPAPMLYVSGLDEEKWFYETILPADHYYACLDGTYNYDQDDRPGEPTDGDQGTDVDLYAELSIGRASVSDLTEVGYFVQKTISYLSTSRSDPYTDVYLLAGEYLGDYGIASWGGNYLDLLIDDSTEDGYSTTGIPSDTYDIVKLYDREQTWNANNIIDAINNGVHIINHDGHSNYGYNMKMSSNYVSMLTNTDYCFSYSVGCMAGGFDDPNEYDCFAEYLTVKTNHGAFAAIMNARYGWFWSYSTDGDGTRYTREFWDSVFGESTPVISAANQDSKEDNIHLIDRSCMRWTFYELNYFGDPTIAFHISNPPQQPEMPNGPNTGKKETPYEYSTQTIDTNGDDLYYFFDWGDGTTTDWLGPVASGATIQASHSWDEPGDYFIQVKARDSHGMESLWSEPLTITIPKNKDIHFPLIAWILQQLNQFRLLLDTV